MLFPDVLYAALTIAAVAMAWITAGAAWWSYRRHERDRAHKLGHLAWMTSIVALFVPIAADRIAAVFPPGGLSAPQ
jgi:hypothetical protein